MGLIPSRLHGSTPSPPIWSPLSLSMPAKEGATETTRAAVATSTNEAIFLRMAVSCVCDALLSAADLTASVLAIAMAAIVVTEKRHHSAAQGCDQHRTLRRLVFLS